MRNKIFLFVSLLGLLACSKPSAEQKAPLAKENFHLYLLMGQSNMAGRGKVEAIDTVLHPQVFMFNKAMEWVPAREPVQFDKAFVGTGLGFSFGKAMAQQNEQIKIGLIPCAKGGSSLNQWEPDSFHTQTKSYPYNEMVQRAKAALEAGTLKGILWHQGEADSGSEASVASYEERFYGLMRRVKDTLGVESVPIVMGELGYFFCENKPNAQRLNERFAAITAQDPEIELVSAEGLDHKGDYTHFDAASYRTLGERYAAKMGELQE